MADDQYQSRYQEALNSLGGQLGGMTGAIVTADAAAKTKNLTRQLEILGLDNIKASASTTIIGSENPLTVSYDVPAALVADLRGLEVSTASIHTVMNVSASTEDNLSVKSNTEVSGAAKIGYGIFSASVGFKANVGVNKDIRRKSDYSSTMEVDIQMAQSPMPEGLNKILDSMNKVVEAATDINEQKLLGQLAPAASQGALPAPTPAPAGGGKK